MVPFGDALHETDTLALGGIGDDQVGLPVLIVDGVESLDDILHRVTVHIDDIPSEGTPALTDRVDRHHILRVTTDLQVVTVDDGDEVVQFVLAASHGSLIDGTLTLFTVTHQHIGVVGRDWCGRVVVEIGVTVHFLSDRHTDADAESVS